MRTVGYAVIAAAVVVAGILSVAVIGLLGIAGLWPSW